MVQKAIKTKISLQKNKYLQTYYLKDARRTEAPNTIIESVSTDYTRYSPAKKLEFERNFQHYRTRGQRQSKD
jgi:hypothetical protein